MDNKGLSAGLMYYNRETVLYVALYSNGYRIRDGCAVIEDPIRKENGL